ncbi:MAG TPA: type III secretion system stator protein SctL [Caldimonas sp.]|jgi:type III secretion protein L|nr:type III secretion system stator protein SctL [Caldimonas sp.]
MVIWLRHSQLEGANAGAGIGVEDGVVRAADLGRVVDIDAALQAMREQGEAELAAARANAQALVEAAEARAAELIAQADQQYESAERDGYEAGLRAALTDWHERVAHGPDADGRTLDQRRRDRLAELVVLAVEQMIATSDPADVFRRAAATLEQIVADGSPLDVHVHPADLDAARRAFADIARGWRDAGCAVRLRVHADAQLDPGSCVCESDLGTVDASLSLQLEAMRAALARAVDSIADEQPAGDDGESADHDAAYVGDAADLGESADHDAAYAGDAADSNESADDDAAYVGDAADFGESADHDAAYAGDAADLGESADRYLVPHPEEMLDDR